MGQFDPQHHRQVVVGTVATAVEADMLVMMLTAEGIPATTAGSGAGSIYPSLDFVEGIRIVVLDEDAAEARELLAGRS